MFGAWIGRREIAKDRITPALVARLAASLDTSLLGSSAPQGIHWCLCPPDAPTAELGVDGHPARGGFLPPIDLPRRMWAASDIDFRVPLRIGADVERRSTVTAIAPKRGRSGTLVFVTVEHEIRSDDTLCVLERQTIVYRGAAGAAAPPSHPLPAAAPAWDWGRTLTPTEPLLFRYSALTFNSHRIHYDQPYATQVEGYPGLVVHGPLIATLLLDLCARELGAEALATFNFKAHAPAFCGETLELGGRVEDQRVRLEARVNDRVVALAESHLR